MKLNVLSRRLARAISGSNTPLFRLELWHAQRACCLRRRYLDNYEPGEKVVGEGDEKIWVDGEDFPSIFCTGTDDYYAYSWGGRSTDFYEHPFHAQSRCNVYNKSSRKTADQKSTQGYSTETRSCALDTMPFGSSLQLNMDVWS